MPTLMQGYRYDAETGLYFLNVRSKTTIKRNDGRVEYLAKGTFNGKEGVYHITVNKKGEIIHRVFEKKYDWARNAQKYDLPSWDSFYKGVI